MDHHSACLLVVLIVCLFLLFKITASVLCKSKLRHGSPSTVPGMQVQRGNNISVSHVPCPDLSALHDLPHFIIPKPPGLGATLPEIVSHSVNLHIRKQSSIAVNSVFQNYSPRGFCLTSFHNATLHVKSSSCLHMYKI